ncbi:MAG: MarR family transcriptional regulator [Lachnospiraceae bacterium]|nr:MarR family transcriptional regulator [Lachnospiraceae bacterium]
MEDYRVGFFGLSFEVSELDTKSLPKHITSQRTFTLLSWRDIGFILVGVPANERFGLSKYENDTALITETYRFPVAFRFEYLSIRQRDELIDRNIPFIVARDQLFFPFLGMALRNRFVKPKKINAEKMMPVSQMLFLYMLYKSDGKGVQKKEAAENLGTTRASITRASDQLSTMGLIAQEKRGKEVYMQVKETGLQLYEMAKPYMINPIQRVITVKGKIEYIQHPFSGETALSKCSGIGFPSLLKSHAIFKDKIRPDTVREIDIRCETEKSGIQLELWKYDPSLFEYKGIVDPVSLALCFKDCADKRIESALKTYLKEYPW